MSRRAFLKGSLAVSALFTASCFFPSPMSMASNAAFNTAANAPQAQAEAEQCKRDAYQPVDVDHERALGGGIALNWVHQTAGVDLDEQFERYLNAVGKNLAHQSARPNLAWTFGVLKSDDVNALSAPAGYVLVTRGLLRQLHNEAELAGVLAHEIGHVTERHALAAYQKVRADACVTNAWTAAAKQSISRDIASSGPLGALAASDPNFVKMFDGITDNLAASISKGYQRDQEFAADRVGMELLLNAGYQPEPFIAFLGTLKSNTGWSSVHPPPADRQNALRTFVASFKDNRTSLLAGDYPFAKYKAPPITFEVAAATPP